MTFRRLEKIREEASNLVSILSREEEELAHLNTTLTAFQKRFYEIVQKKVIRLAELKSEILQEQANLNPTEENVERANQAKTNVATISMETEINYIEPSKNISDFSQKPTRKLRSLFIDLAKNIHPDLACSESEKVWREKFMREANIAYKELDELKLEIISLQVIKHTKFVDFDYMDEQQRDEAMLYLLNIIPKIKKRIKQIKEEIYELEHQEIYQIYQNYVNKLEEGIDILLQQSYRLDVKILNHESQLNNYKENEQQIHE